MKIKSLNTSLFKKDNLLFLISLTVLIVAEMFCLNYLRLNMSRLLDSDMSSEMILSKILSDNNEIITRDWYYSSEIRVINTQLVFSFLFKLFNSWHRVRVIGTAVVHFLLILSVAILCKSAGNIRMFPLISLFFAVPLSVEYFLYVTRALYYIPHISISILGLSLLFFLCGGRKKRNCVLLVICFIFAVAACMGGPRQILVFYLPVLISGLLIFFFEYIGNEHSGYRTDIFYFAIGSVLSFTGAVIGYLINTRYLMERYHFQSWEDQTFKFPDWSGFISVINGFLQSLGYMEGTVDSRSVISNTFAGILLILTVIAVCYGIRKKKSVGICYYITSVLTACSYVIYILLYSLTDMYFAIRYNIPVIAYSFIVIVMFIHALSREYKRISLWFLYAFFTVMIILSGTITINLIDEYVLDEDSYEPKMIADIMSEQGYEAGYATFWSANIITELSEGRIDMHCFDNVSTPSMMAYIDNINQLHQWLDPVSHDTERPSGKVFILLPEEDYSYSYWKDNLTDDYLVYNSGNYRAYGFSSYPDMLSVLSHYEVSLSDNLFVNNGYDEDGSRILNPGGSTFGPYIIFYAGHHRVTVTGENLDPISADCTCFNGSVHIPFEIVSRTDDEYIVEFDVPEDSFAGELAIYNISADEDVTIDSIVFDYIA